METNTGPLHVRLREFDQPPVQQRFEGEMPPVLLPGGDDQRRAPVIGVDHGSHGVAEAGGGVQVDQGRVPRCLGVAVRHRERDALLQAKHVCKVLGEVLQKRQLGGTRVAEHRRHP
jgi:hypothetical protein